MVYGLVSNHAETGYIYSRDSNNFHWNVLPWLCTILLGQNTALRDDEGTHKVGTHHWTNAKISGQTS